MPTIREIRESQGLTQAELANRAFVSARVISEMENGKPVRKMTLARVCNALGVPVSEVQGVRVLKRSRRA